jgi:hypothetical protein
MEQINTSTEKKTPEGYRGTSAPSHMKRNILISLMLCILLAVAAVIFLKQNTNKGVKIYPPEKDLIQLENSSRPTIQSEEYRTDELTALQKKSTPVTVSSEEKLKKLQMLSQ